MNKIKLGYIIYFLTVLIFGMIIFLDIKYYYVIFGITLSLLVIENIINGYLYRKKVLQKGTDISNKFNCGYRMILIDKELMGTYNVAVMGILDPIIIVENTVYTELSYEELKSTVTHEIGHIKNNHLIKTLLLNYISLAIVTFGIHESRFNDSILATIISVVGIVLVIFSYTFNKNVEYIADEYAINNLGDVSSFEEGLSKITNLNNKGNKKPRIIIDMHPTFEKRIARIKKKQGERLDKC